MFAAAHGAARELDEGLTQVRYQQTADSAHPSTPTHEGTFPMTSSTLAHTDIDHLVHDRIGELYATAREVH